MKIEILGGTSPRLYKFVASACHECGCSATKQQLPYKTSLDTEWLVGLDDDGKTVRGFFPIERREGYYYLNNYYVPADSEEELLHIFIEKAITLYAPICPLVAVVHSHHVPVFQKKGFLPEREWKLYVKMRYGKSDGKTS